MRRHHPLGFVAGARGVDQAGERAARDRRRLRLDLAGFAAVAGQRVEPGAILGRLHAHHQIERPGGAQRRRERRRADDCRGGAAVGQHMRVIGGGVGDVGRHRNRADGHQRPFADQHLRPVLADDDHPVAGANPEGAQPARQAGRLPSRRRPAERVPGSLPIDPKSRPPRPGARRGEQQAGQVWRVRDPVARRSCFQPRPHRALPRRRALCQAPRSP